VVRADPATEAFLRKPDGEIALIDWGSFMAAYFAWRITTNVQTGLTTDDGNQTGLANAHSWFTSN
jgi:hypothetical protein